MPNEPSLSSSPSLRPTRSSRPATGACASLCPPDRQVAVDQFDRLQSEAATFWEVYNYVAVDPDDETGVFDDGLRATAAQQFGWHKQEAINRGELATRRWQVRLARDLLAAIAFQMFLGQDGDGATRPMFTVVKDLDKFLNRAFDRFEKSTAYQTARNKPIDGEFLWEDWRRLKAMDSRGLKHLVFSATEERLQFTDITTQTFFAAYWACRWADEDDRRTMGKWLPDPLEKSNEVYQEFWRFVTEMPVEAIDQTRYEWLLSPLYDGSWTDEKGRPIRSTELIYRSWNGMKDTVAGRVFRDEFRQLLSGKGNRDRVAAALKLLGVGGECPFVSLCEGKRGANDTGHFQMGAPDGEYPEWDGSGEQQRIPLHPVRLTHYRLH